MQLIIFNKHSETWIFNRSKDKQSVYSCSFGDPVCMAKCRKRGLDQD